MKKLIFYTTLVSLLCLFAQPVFAYTETFYLCQGGDGSSPEAGTCADAWDADDICTAENWDTDDQDDGKLGPNDLLVVMDDGGTITGSGSYVIETKADGLSGKPITIQAQSGDSPILDGENARQVIYSVLEDYIVIDGLELKRGFQFTLAAYRAKR